LRTYSAWLRGTSPVGISNDSMGSAPNHPFYLRVIQKLERFARNWKLPYLTVMLSTGPLFLSIMWKEYIMSGPPDELRIAIMPEEWYLSTNSQGLPQGIHPQTQRYFLPLVEVPGTEGTLISSFGLALARIHALIY
jgi:hypothetical protein